MGLSTRRKQAGRIQAGLGGLVFLVGKDRDGRWIVRDASGLQGGLFADQKAAIRFAEFESGHRPGAVRCLPEGSRLSLTGPVVSRRCAA